MLFPTTLVRGYPQPDWLIDRAKLPSHRAPRDADTEWHNVGASSQSGIGDQSSLACGNKLHEAGRSSIAR